MILKKNICLTAFLFSCILSTSQIDTKIFNAFKQGNVKEGGNCVSIALIKAAYSKYGFERLFLKTSKNDDKYIVKMRDSITVSFSQSELNEVKSRASFKLKDTTSFSKKFLDFANFCYAAMCKKNQILKKYKKFDEAIVDLNNGYDTKKSYSLLGLKFKKISPHRASKLNKLKHIIIYNKYHAAYASDGFYDESWNKETGIDKVSKFKWRRFGFKCFYKLCSISGAFQIID